MSNLFSDPALLAGQNEFFVYCAVYVATIFIGNVSAFASFWVAPILSLGPWGIPRLILAIFLGNVSGDLLWYSLGRGLRDTRIGNFVMNRIPRHHEKFEELVQKNGVRWFFMTKLLYGSVPPIVFSLGWSKASFKKFFSTSVLATLAWLPILLGIAYGLIAGLTPLRTAAFFNRFWWVFLLGLALFLTAEYFAAKLLRKTLKSTFTARLHIDRNH
ncbi:hypothetical protein C4571_03215 [Candidatus Parcubacteria bacterium]|nr:MAG: hypothetical protein C4571_03215 [Candidatus Parcubacteria bacterium]